MTSGAWTRSRGDVVVVWHVESAANPRDLGPYPLRAALQRPGQRFGEPDTLGLANQQSVAISLAGDGTGAVAWVRAGRSFARLLGANGTGGPPIKLPGEVQLAAAPGGRVSAAWLGSVRGTRISL